jgi:hypothetical protein
LIASSFGKLFMIFPSLLCDSPRFPPTESRNCCSRGHGSFETARAVPQDKLRALAAWWIEVQCSFLEYLFLFELGWVARILTPDGDASSQNTFEHHGRVRQSDQFRPCGLRIVRSDGDG